MLNVFSQRVKTFNIFEELNSYKLYLQHVIERRYVKEIIEKMSVSGNVNFRFECIITI